MLKPKDNIKDQWVDFKYWCLNWFEIIKFAGSNPYKVVTGLFKYPWIYDLLKAIKLAKSLGEERSGSYLLLSHMGIHMLICRAVEFMKRFIYGNENLVLAHNLIPPEIFYAMGVDHLIVEFPGALIPMIDQHACERYIDSIENEGLPADTCTYPRIVAGVYNEGEIPHTKKALLYLNMPCEGGFASYYEIEKGENVPTYILDVPYNFKTVEDIAPFLDDLKGMITFLEKHTGRKMDWDKLREICRTSNKMNELELERWEMARGDAPAIAGDALWIPHLWCYNYDTGHPDTLKYYEESQKVIKKAYENKEPVIKDIKYRMVLWNPPPMIYSTFLNWFEQCWGVVCINDMLTFGHFDEYYIDTSTNESMLTGIARRWCYPTMSRNTRGPVDNYLPDIFYAMEWTRSDFLLIPAHISCRGSISLTGVLKEECHKRNIPVCFFEYGMMDVRVCSRQGIRDQVNNFMFNVMKAKPLDESLLSFDDGNVW